MDEGQRGWHAEQPEATACAAAEQPARRAGTERWRCAHGSGGGGWRRVFGGGAQPWQWGRGAAAADKLGRPPGPAGEGAGEHPVRAAAQLLGCAVQLCTNIRVSQQNSRVCAGCSAEGGVPPGWKVLLASSRLLSSGEQGGATHHTETTVAVVPLPTERNITIENHVPAGLAQVVPGVYGPAAVPIPEQKVVNDTTIAPAGVSQVVQGVYGPAPGAAAGGTQRRGVGPQVLPERPLPGFGWVLWVQLSTLNLLAACAPRC